MIVAKHYRVKAEKILASKFDHYQQRLYKTTENVLSPI